MNATAPRAPTAGAIASLGNQPLHRVLYVIKTRGIKPAAIAGSARVFSPEDVQFILGECRRIEREREGVFA